MHYRFALLLSLLFAASVLFADSTGNNRCAYGGSPELISELDGAVADALHNESGSVQAVNTNWVLDDGRSDYYTFTPGSDGNLSIAASTVTGDSGGGYQFFVGTSCLETTSGWDLYNGSSDATSHTPSAITVTAGTTYYVWLLAKKNKWTDYAISLDFVADSGGAPASPPDETLPIEGAEALSAECGTFEDMFQTRTACTTPTSATIAFNNGGQTLDGSTDVIRSGNDSELATCQVTAPSWVLSGFETCGAHGDCTATGEEAAALSLDYAKTPATANIDASPTDETATQSANTDQTLAGYAYHEVSNTAWSTNTTTTFNITNQLAVNTLSMQNEKSFHFQSATGDPYAINIGKLEGAYTTRFTTDGNAKNIKIRSFDVTYDTVIDLDASQTIQMESLGIDRSSTVTLKAQYVLLNSLHQGNGGSGASTVNIVADYIDIGTLEMDQMATLNITPYTPGKRVLFKANSISASSSSSMVVDAGNYYTGSFNIPGSSSVSSLRAGDADQLVNFYINGNFTPGNNPGINSNGNTGNYDLTLPASNFMLFINGNLSTGGGGTTFNATVYVEGDVTLGNPTYIRGALSANQNISVGQGQFIYDQNIGSAGYGACSSGLPYDFDNIGCFFPDALSSRTSINVNGGQDVFNSGGDLVTPVINGTLNCIDSGAACTPTGTMPDQINLPTYQYSSASGTTTVTSNSSFGSLDEGNIVVGSGGITLTFTAPSDGYMKIKSLKSSSSNNHVTYTFNEGDYWIDEWELGGNQDEVFVNGPVRIFVNKLTYLKNSIDMNKNGNPGNLFIISYGDIDFTSNGGGNGEIWGYVYTVGSFNSSASSNAIDIHGAITSENPINLDKNSDYTYDPSGLGPDLMMCSDNPLNPQFISFDIVDYCAAEDISCKDNNISTKLSNGEIALTFFSMDDANATLTPWGAKVQFWLAKDTTPGNGVADYTALYPLEEAELNATSIYHLATFSETSAIQDTRIMIRACDNNVTSYDWDHCFGNGSYNVPADQREYFSWDNFAIRPASFTLSLTAANPEKLQSGVAYPLEATATQLNSSAATPGYDATLDNTNNTVASAIYDLNVTAVCPVAGPDDFSASFSDGNSSTSVTVADVADLNITLSDSSWTTVDQANGGCTPDSNSTAASPVGCDITAVLSARSVPDHFTVTANLSNANTVGGFTYLSDLTKDGNTSAIFDMSVTAANSGGTTVQNYMQSCYAQPTSYTLAFTMPAGNLGALQYFETNSSTFAEHNLSLPQEVTLSANATIFTADNNGTALQQLMLNFDRRANQLVEPFRFTLNSVTFFESAATDINGSATLDQNVTYYYGRAHAPRYRQNCTGATACTANVPVYYEVYNPSRLTFAPNSLLSVDDVRWYQNLAHDASAGTSDGLATAIAQRNPLPTNQFTLSAAAGSTGSAVSSGSATYSGDRGYPFKTVLEISASPWLIYHRFNAAAATNSFDLEFSSSGQWSGEDAGTTKVSTTPALNTSRRIQW